jgi:hypothetical protein
MVKSGDEMESDRYNGFDQAPAEDGMAHGP